MNWQENLGSLIKQKVDNSGECTFRVTGGSMIPIIPPRSTVQIVKVSKEQVKEGDIVAFLVKDQLVIHRVVRITDQFFECSGDAYPGVFQQIPWKDLVGKVIRVKFGSVIWPLEGTTFHLLSIPSIILGESLRKLIHKILN